jgi:hypothetical protein
MDLLTINLRPLAPRRPPRAKPRDWPVCSARSRTATSLAVGAAVALAVQLATAYAIRADLLPLCDPPYADKLAGLRAHPGFAPAESEGRPITLLFVGSSRTHNGIDAGAAEELLSDRLGRPVAAFNFGCPAAGPVTCAVYLRRLLADGARPDAAVIEVHPLLLAAQTKVPPESRWLTPARLRPEEVPLVRKCGLPVEAGAHDFRSWLLPVYEYRTPMLDRYAKAFSLAQGVIGGLPDDDDRGGMRLREVAADERPKLLARTRREYAECLAGYRPGGCGVAALRDALETCRAAGIRPTILLTPESSEFRGWYPEPGRSELVSLLTGLSREFACPLMDAREWLPDEWIGDGHHLTGFGADAFTERLSREALAPWLAPAVTGDAP